MANDAKIAVQRGAASGSPLRHPIETLRREFDRLFDGFGTHLPGFGRGVFDLESLRRSSNGFGATPPAVDVVENETEYAITAELPGVEQENIEVSLADEVLTIKGEKKQESEEEGRDCYVAERSYGFFQRSFRLPEDADAGRIAAKFKNGVLTVNVPKAPAARPNVQKVEVTAA